MIVGNLEPPSPTDLDGVNLVMSSVGACASVDYLLAVGRVGWRVVVRSIVGDVEPTPSANFGFARKGRLRRPHLNHQHHCISTPTATNAPAVATSAPKWLVLTIFFPFYSPRAGRSDLPRCRSLWRFCFWERIATPRPCEGPSPPRRPLLGDLYAHEVHRTVERIVERVCRFGSHHDVGSVGDRAGRARLGAAALSVHPSHHRGARLYALQPMPVSVYDVAPRHFVHRAPVSLEEAVQLADGGVGRPLYLHLVVAAWGAGETLADDVVGVLVHRRIGYLDAGS